MTAPVAALVGFVRRLPRTLPGVVPVGKITCTIVGALVACAQQETGTPRNLRMQVYLREIYHESALTVRGAFDVLAARQVWQLNPVLAYDEAFTDRPYLGELDPCGVEPVVLQRTAVGGVEFLLFEDSGFFRTRSFSNDPIVYAHPDAERLFHRFWTLGDSGMLVFLMPRFLHQRADLSAQWTDYYGVSSLAGSIAPSAWLNTREVQADARWSTLSHEMAHLVLTRRLPEVWFDNSTPFVHILYATGVLGGQRRTTTPGPVDIVAATDVNRRYLILHRVNNACSDARSSIEFVRPVFP